MMETEQPRLQKALATAGVASRRACEEMIRAGRVAVNGKIVRELGTKVDPQADDIRVDGERVLIAPPKLVYVMLNKPLGVVSTASDPNAERTVTDLVEQVGVRVYPVGRLDADSAGLLLLTNDGDFAYRMTHPRYHVPKVYLVSVRGFLDRTDAQKLAFGVELPDGKTAPADLKFIEYDDATQCTVVEMTLYEGRNRQVRRMMEAVGHPVRTLTRIAFGSLKLKGLAPGTWRKLRPEEVEALRDLAKPTPTPKKEARRTQPNTTQRNTTQNAETRPAPPPARRNKEAPTSAAKRPPAPRRTAPKAGNA